MNEDVALVFCADRADQISWAETRQSGWKRLTGTQLDEYVRVKVTRALYELLWDPAHEVVPPRLSLTRSFPLNLDPHDRQEPR